MGQLFKTAVKFTTKANPYVAAISTVWTIAEVGYSIYTTTQKSSKK